MTPPLPAPLHRLARLALWAALAAPALHAGAAPHVPASDDEVLERLPQRAADPAAREFAALRARLAREPRNPELAVAVARRYFDTVAAEGDPRFIGYAEAALAPWWHEPAPPPRVRVMRALLLQFNHQFAPAIADLDGALQADPSLGEAWAWRTAIALVQADYATARRGCEHMAALATPLIASACRAQVDSLTGHAADAASALGHALQQAAQADPAERLWALTRLAEIEERRGAYAQAEAAFRAGLALNLADAYLMAAYADFLLDRGRPAEVLTLLKDSARADTLLLRLALAARDARSPLQAGYVREMGERFDAARRRGDASHQKEESRYTLALLHQPQRALALAQENYRVQREPADARILLEAALAAGQPAAAQPVLQWLRQWQVESVALQTLAAKLK